MSYSIESTKSKLMRWTKEWRMKLFSPSRKIHFSKYSFSSLTFRHQQCDSACILNKILFVCPITLYVRYFFELTSSFLLFIYKWLCHINKFEHFSSAVCSLSLYYMGNTKDALNKLHQLLLLLLLHDRDQVQWK